VLNIRPAEADAILPANNPKLADQKLGAAVFQEIQILRFLGDTAAVNRHEAVLQFITGRGNATRAEIEAFYRNNIQAFISSRYDEGANNVKGFSNSLPINTIRITAIRTSFKEVILNFFISPNQTTFDILNHSMVNAMNEIRRQGSSFAEAEMMDYIVTLWREIAFQLPDIARLVLYPR
ncbi:MAG: hypothetical protein LBQ89_01470, partial [Treponema sp.]|nr:hypothetical protein [Treponema sp.]